MVERYNRTICEQIQKIMTDEAEWADLLPTIDFQYNTSVHDATGTESYRAMFGTLPFDADTALALKYYQDTSRTPASLKENLQLIHQAMREKNLKARLRAAKIHDRSVKEGNYEVGERVYVYDSLQKIAQGRKLRLPWTGP